MNRPCRKYRPRHAYPSGDGRLTLVLLMVGLLVGCPASTPSQPDGSDTTTTTDTLQVTPWDTNLPPVPDISADIPVLPPIEGCIPEDGPIISPIWMAGGSGSRAELGKFGKPDALFLDDNGLLLAGDEDEDYEELHIFDTKTDDPTQDADFITPLLDIGADPGPGGSGPLEFIGISGFSQDPNTKRLYLVDQGNGRIQMLQPTPDGKAPYYTYEGTLGGFAENLDDPKDGVFVRLQAARVDQTGRLFVSDDAKDNAKSARRDIQLFDPDGTYLGKFGDASYGSLGKDGNLSEPENFVIDEQRNRIYVCDEGPGNVVVYRYSDLSYIQRIEGFIGTPNGIDIDDEGFIYVVDEGKKGQNHVKVFHPESLEEVFRFGGYSDNSDLTPGRFNSPDTLIINVAQDVLLVADQGHDRIQAFRLSDIQKRACLKRLMVTSPSHAVAGKTTTLRVELMGHDDQPLRSTLVQTGSVTLKDAEGNQVGESTAIELYGGSGTVTLTLSTPGVFSAEVRVGGYVGTRIITVLDKPQTLVLAGELGEAQREWHPDNGVIHITGDIQVPAGTTLKIHPGTLVMIAPESRIDIHGNVEAMGTEAEPIYFFAEDATKGWEQIDHTAPQRVAYHNVFFAHGGHAYWERNDEFRHCCAYHLRTHGGVFEMVRTVIADSPGKGALTFGAQVTIRGAMFTRLGFGVELVEGKALVMSSVFGEFRGEDDNDAIYLSAVDAPGEFDLRRLVITRTDDDGVDTENSSPTIHDVMAFDIEDKAFSLTGGSPSFTNCLVVRSRIAVKIDDKFRTADSHLLFRNCTFVDNKEYGYWGSDRNGLDADAHIEPIFDRTVIWDNPTSIGTDFDPSLITVKYSNVQNLSADFQVTDVLSLEPILLRRWTGYRLHPLSPGWTQSGFMGWQGWPGKP